MTPNQEIADRLLLPQEVVQRVRLSKPTIYRLRRAGEFPAPIVVGRKRIAFRESEIEMWLATRAKA